MHQNHCVVYKTTDLVFTLPEKANNWVLDLHAFRFFIVL